jgi:hypothetical protein
VTSAGCAPRPGVCWPGVSEVVTGYEAGFYRDMDVIQQDVHRIADASERQAEALEKIAASLRLIATTTLIDAREGDES